MRQFDHPYIQYVLELGAPSPEDIIITHGSALVVYGVRPENSGGDIDLVTTPENITYLRKILGWEVLRRSTGYDKEGLPKTVTRTLSPEGDVDVYSHDFIAKWYRESGRGRLYPSELKDFSEQDKDTGLWIAKPRLVRLTKEESKRPKDVEDIRLIDEYYAKISQDDSQA